MKKKLFLSAVFLSAFLLYAHSPFRFQGPADKAVQLLTVVPAVLFFAFSGLAPFRGLIRVFSMMSTGRFLATISSSVFVFMVYMALIPLEGIPKGGDEAAYYFQSRIFAGGELVAPAPPVDDPRDLFPFRHFIFRNGEWFVMYTPLHAVLMAPLTAAGVAWLLGPLESIIALFGAFLLMRRVSNESFARLGTAVMAVSPFFLFMGSTHMAHNTNLMFVTWALYFLIRGVQENRISNQMVCGLLLGLALNTKPYPIVPWSLTITLVLFVRLKWRAVPILLRVIAGAVLPVILILLTNYRYTGDPLSPAYNLARGGELMGFGENKAWFPEYGDHAHTPLRGLLNLFKQAGAGSTILLGWPFLSLLPAAAVLLDRQMMKRTWPLYCSVMIIAPFMFIHYAAAIDYGPRHYYTTLPAFALLTAAGINILVKKWKTVAETALISLFIVSTLMIYMPDGIELRSGPWQSIDSVPMKLAEETVETPAVVFMEASEHGYPNIMSGLLATDPFLQGNIVFCAHQTTEEDLEHIHGIFLGRTPYLFHMEQREAFIDPWSESLSQRLAPERSLRPEWTSEDVSEGGF